MGAPLTSLSLRVTSLYSRLNMVCTLGSTDWPGLGTKKGWMCLDPRLYTALFSDTPGLRLKRMQFWNPGMPAAQPNDNGWPDCMRSTVPTSQPPAINDNGPWLKNCFPLPKGSSYRPLKTKVWRRSSQETAFS